MGRKVGVQGMNFWKQISNQKGWGALLQVPGYDTLRDWVPDQSNCPELEQEVHRFLQSAPLDYAHLLREVFVGRTFEGGVNAQARAKNGAAWVELSFQYTSVIGAYVAAFDRFNHVLQLRQRGNIVKAHILASVFDDIALSREYWADESRFIGVAGGVMSGPHGREAEFYGEVALNGEMFVIFHEYAHLLLGHEGRATALKSARSEVDQSIKDWNRNDALRAHSTEQRKHFEADVLALNLANYGRGQADTGSGYRTIIGALCALLALGHIENEWVVQSDTSHPGALVRINTLLKGVPGVFKVMPALADHDSVEGLGRQLAAFAQACVQTSLHTLDPQIHAKPTWQTVEESLMAGSVALSESSMHALSRPPKV
ncbi:hypothetical protein CMMCA001_07015 [Clavibacter michiganensis subsp. michiganensis]|nr:hypothetical protein CMMCA001_07015 [Clavibacter michiganensis subsp. michiganensis]